MNHSVELVSTGTELLDGRSVNTHARLLGASIVPLGLQLARDTSVPDNTAAIRDAIEAALARVDVVIVSGGLGPTSDDLTREIIAEITGRKIVMHEPSRLAIHERLAKRGRKATESLDRHALVSEGATVLANAAGLAPGERIDVSGKFIFLLPGPPSEFRCILQEHLLPWLRKSFPETAAPLCRSFRVCGPGESDLVTKLEPRGFPAPGVEVAYCAHAGNIEIRLLSKDSAALEQSAALIRELFRDAIFAETDGPAVSIEEVVGQKLKSAGQTLAVAESCTGGLIGHRITNISGSSDYFRGGLIAYANEIKIAQLNVSPETLAKHGAVSETVAREMAEGVRRALGADIGLSMTGIAGPGGGTPEKPVGLVFVAVADARGTVAREIRTGGEREYIKTVAAQRALDFLRRRLQGLA